MTVSFNDRSGILYACINFGSRGNKQRISTRISLEGITFDSKLQKIRGKDTQSIRVNALISKIKSMVDAANVSEMVPEDLCDEISQLVEDRSVSRNATSQNGEGRSLDEIALIAWDYLNKNRRFKGKTSIIALKTIETYSSAIKAYRRFVKETGRSLTLKEVDIKRRTLDGQRKATIRFGDHIAAFRNHLLEEGFSLGTQSQYINSLFKSFLKRVVDTEYGAILPEAERIKGDDSSPIITLPDGFFEQLITDQDGLYDKMNPIEKAGYEITCLMLVTALRVQDAFDITPNSFQELKDGTLQYKGIHQKTKKQTSVPLPNVIADKIRYNIKTYDWAFSYDFTEGNANASHKVSQIMQKALKLYPKMNEIHTEERLTPDGKNRIAISKPWFEWLTPHTMRKTAITYLLNKGVHERLVKQVSGHSERSLAFERYVKHSEAVLQTTLKGIHEMLN